jgi:hypothetical protein
MCRLRKEEMQNTKKKKKKKTEKLDVFEAQE